MICNSCKNIYEIFMTIACYNTMKKEQYNFEQCVTKLRNLGIIVKHINDILYDLRVEFGFSVEDEFWFNLWSIQDSHTFLSLT